MAPPLLLRRPGRGAEGERRSWSLRSPWLGQRGFELVDPTPDDAGERTTIGFGFSCQSGLLLLGSDYYSLESALTPQTTISLLRHPLFCSGAVRLVTAPEQGRPTTYSWAKASRSCFSCSSGRLVEIISKSYAFSSSTTLSTAVAPLVSANRAEVPSVTFSRTCFIKSSSMPTSDIAPDIPPIAAPRRGTKKIIPIRKPQKAPQPAPPPCNSRVLGFLLPWGQLTTAASSSVINSRSCMPCRAIRTRSAPLGSLNFSTDSVAIRVILAVLCTTAMWGRVEGG